jgi:protein-disulfide isomerase
MPETTSGKIRPFWMVIAFGLVAFGTVCSGYLLSRHFSLVSGKPDRLDACQAIFSANCDAAIRSDMAVQLGIPLAGWGLVQFIVVAVLLLFAISLGNTFRTEASLAAFFICSAATAIGAALTGMMVTRATPFCPLCVVVHLVNLSLAAAILVASGQSVSESCAAIGRGIQYVFGARVEDPLFARWKVVGLVTAGLVGVVIYQWVLIQTDRHSSKVNEPPSFDKVLAEFEREQVHDIPVGDEDPWLGDKNAPVRLVVFSDFQCPACMGFAHMLQHLREDHPKLSIVFKHFPLSSQCNSEVKRDLHPLSCGAAFASEAARRQGKFWEYHDALFAATDPLDGPTLEKLATAVGLDINQFAADLAAESTKAKAAADVALGNKMKISGTPTIFLNGKELSGSGRAFLQQLIKHESGS